MTPADTFTRALKWAEQLDHAANLGIADAYRARRCANKLRKLVRLTKEREMLILDGPYPDLSQLVRFMAEWRASIEHMLSQRPSSMEAMSLRFVEVADRARAA